MSSRHLVRYLVLPPVLLAGVIFAACGGGNSKPAAEYGPDVAVGWYDLAYRLTRSESISPPVASRAFGYIGVALYESVVPGMPGHRSLSSLVNGELAVPAPQEGAVYHWPTAANAALATVMPAFYQKENSYLAIASLYDKQRAQASEEAGPPVIARSEEYGRAVGIAVLRWALGDGYESIRDCAYTVPGGPGHWVPTPPTKGKALEPCWGRLRPFVLANVAQYRPIAPTAFSDQTSSQFYVEALEVYLVRNNLTAEQREIALYWADNPGQ
ncbi:MAG: hypothetical protein HY682_11315, partial [Chloroflexi bacterium]|nr:hypothetical protein [Chloroflexota bacterium]